jgi:hypothetical protein
MPKPVPGTKIATQRGVSSLQMTVNALSLDFTNDTRLKPKPCAVCGEPTTGRAEISDAAGSRKIAACMSCAVDQVAGKALGPIPRMIREALR